MRDRAGELAEEFRKISSEGSEDRAEETRVLIARAFDGSSEAESALFERVYEDLRALASGYMNREARGHTLQATALVHETFLKVFRGAVEPPGDGSRTFLKAVMSRAMRQILVDHARARGAKKRGRAHKRVPLDEALDEIERDHDSDFLDLEEALSRLAKVDAIKHEILLLEIYGGLSRPEIASHLRLTYDAVRRKRESALVWLKATLG